MNTITVYLFDQLTGFFSGTYEAQRDPLTVDEFITPTYSTTEPLPVLAEGEEAHWNGASWDVIAPPAPPEPVLPTHGELVAQTRLAAKGTAISMLPLLTSMQVDAMASGEEIVTGEPPAPVAVSALIKSFKDQLLAIPDAVDLSACTTHAEMDDVIQAAYFALVMGVPVELRTQFSAMVPR